ncbi:MAG: regulatory protein RecX [Steroidobacteraceae bacterium]
MSFGRQRKSMEPQRAGDSAAARQSAVALLARRDFASGELQRKLEQQGFEAPVAAATVALLAGEGALNDSRYAENYVTYHAGRGQGPRRIGADLKALGLPEELIGAALAGGPDWRALAREVRVRKFGPGEPADWAQKARQARFLQYRGFSSDHIRLALGADLDPD